MTRPICMKHRMAQTLDQHDPGLKDQLENNLIFLAEQEILTLILEDEMKKTAWQTATM